MTLYVDSGFFVADVNRRDQWHDAAKKLRPMVESREDVATHALALGEAIAIIGRSGGGKLARIAFESITDTATVRYPTPDDVNEAMRQVVKYDGRLSLADALFVHYMGPEDEIVSFDADFDRAGVKRIFK